MDQKSDVDDEVDLLADREGMPEIKLRGGTTSLRLNQLATCMWGFFTIGTEFMFSQSQNICMLESGMHTLITGTDTVV